MSSWQAHVLEAYLMIRRLFSDRSGELDVIKVRADVESMAQMFKPLGKIRTEAVNANGIPAEWIIPEIEQEGRAILFIHGGSFNSGSIASHRTLAGNMAIASRSRALLIDYRLAPEHPFPAGVEDTVKAYEWLLEQSTAPERVIVAGDSAGGTLALVLLVRLRDSSMPLPAASVCISPAPDLTFSGESWGFNSSKDLMLDMRKEQKAIQIYLGGADPYLPYVSPLYADLRGLPPILLQVGSYEVLLSDAQRFAEKAEEAGVEITLEVWPGMQHEWQFAAKFLPEGKQAISRIGAFVEEVLSCDREPVPV